MLFTSSRPQCVKIGSTCDMTIWRHEHSKRWQILPDIVGHLNDVIQPTIWMRSREIFWSQEIFSKYVSISIVPVGGLTLLGGVASTGVVISEFINHELWCLFDRMMPEIIGTVNANQAN